MIKKDSSRGQPWCEVVAHEQPQSHLAILNYNDEEVQPNDFYFVVIRQKGQYLLDENSSGKTNDYLAFLGPIFINEVT